MGAATRASTADAVAALAAVARPTAALGPELLAAARAIASSPQLVDTLSDVGVEASARARLVERVFGASTGAKTVQLLQGIASSRWSSGDDLVAAVEQLGVRAAARTSGRKAPLELELFTIEQAVASSSALELALSSNSAPASAKAALLARLLTNASAPARAVVEHLVQLPRGRRIVEALQWAERTAADVNGRTVATVRVAQDLGSEQVARLEATLARRYGRTVAVNQVIDPSVLGGVRIAIGDDVIDGTIRARLDQLRLQLAG